MITFFVICLIIYIIYASVKKSGQKDVRNEEEVVIERNSLPEIWINCNNLSSVDRFLLGNTKETSLERFHYNQGIIDLVMRNGKQFQAPLADCIVSFIDESSLACKVPLSIKIKYKKETVKFYKVEEEFSPKDWEIIMNVLSLAGETRGNAYNKFNKNLSKTYKIMKIIKLLGT